MVTARATDSALRFEAVSHAYRDPDGTSRLVLDQIAFEIAGGEFISLVGASGCGKTTLLRIAGGLTVPTDGNVSYGSDESDNRRSGFVFQTDSLMPWRTVNANVGLGLEIWGIAAEERRKLVANALQMVKLDAFGKHFPKELSGGMRQRVNIARALAIEPSVLLMDEPFAALDAQTRAVMQEELLALCEQLGATVLFVTHQIEEAVLLADRVVVLSASPGRIREIVTPPFGRPRSSAIKRESAFAQTVDYIWNMIRSEVQLGVDRELGRAAG